jgi:hypothetical protein
MAETVQIVVSWVVTPSGLVAVFSQFHFPTAKKEIFWPSEGQDSFSLFLLFQSRFSSISFLSPIDLTNHLGPAL